MAGQSPFVNMRRPEAGLPLRWLLDAQIRVSYLREKAAA
jgi:hypothetical protein